MISCHGSSNSRRVAILFKNGIDCSINHKIVDPEGRYIILKACIQDKDYVLINVHAPNKDKDQVNFFNNLFSILQNENLDSVDNIALGGDLNCPFDPLLDKKGEASTKRSQLSLVPKISKVNYRFSGYLEIQKSRRKKFYVESKISPSVLSSRLLVDI